MDKQSDKPSLYVPPILCVGYKENHGTKQNSYALGKITISLSVFFVSLQTSVLNICLTHSQKL